MSDVEQAKPLEICPSCKKPAKHFVYPDCCLECYEKAQDRAYEIIHGKR